MDITSILSTIDLDQIILVIGGIIAVLGYIVAAIENVKKKNTQGALENSEKAVEAGKKVLSDAIDLFSSDVPQTEAQTALLENGTVPAKTCFMTDKNKEDLWTNLRAHGGEFTRNDLNDLVSWAEGVNDVEYAIILVDKNGNPDKRIRVAGNPDTEIYHAFVSYGVPTYAKYDEVHAQALATSSPEHNLNTNWIMLDAVKNQIISEIGSYNPKCINDFINKVAEAEKEQLEEYSVNCNNHTWVIKQGDIVAQYAGAKTEA